MDTRVHYLYKITNLVNDKLYIGVTVDPEERKRQHFTKLKIDRLITKAIKKYGKENFRFEVLCCGSCEYIYDLEEKAINLYNSSCTTGRGYNVAQGGLGGSKPRRGKVDKRKDDTSVYVSGFWFPNKRTATSSLNWTNSKYTYRKSEGILGEVAPNFKVAVNKNSTKTVPIYYRGFWFPGVDKACEVFNARSDSIKKDIRKRRFEENDTIQDFKIVRKYFIHGNAYDSIGDAAADLDISAIAIKGRYDRKRDQINYSYTYIKEEI